MPSPSYFGPTWERVPGYKVAHLYEPGKNYPVCGAVQTSPILKRDLLGDQFVSTAAMMSAGARPCKRCALIHCNRVIGSRRPAI